MVSHQEKLIHEKNVLNLERSWDEDVLKNLHSKFLRETANKGVQKETPTIIQFESQENLRKFLLFFKKVENI